MLPSGVAAHPMLRQVQPSRGACQDVDMAKLLQN
jgi:hypothetical protein